MSADAGMRRAARAFARGDLREFVVGRAYAVRHGCEAGDNCAGLSAGPCERKAAAAKLIVRLHWPVEYGRGAAFTVTPVRPTRDQVYAFYPAAVAVPSERWHMTGAFILARDLEGVPEREPRERWVRHPRGCEFCAERAEEGKRLRTMENLEVMGAAIRRKR